MQKKMYTLFGLLAIFSMIAVAPPAFADHASVTVTNAPGSATPDVKQLMIALFQVQLQSM